MNPYDILGIPGDATPEQIKAAYRRKISEAHPDRGGNPAQAARVNAAFDALMAKPEEKDPLEMAKKILVQAFSNLLAGPFPANQDILGAVQQGINAGINDLRIRIRQNHHQLDKLRKIQKKIIYKGGSVGGPMLLDILVRDIADFQSGIAQMEAGIHDMNSAVQMLAEYEWDGEDPMTSTSFYSLGNSKG